MLENNKPIVLVFVSHYFPAYKAGGQLRTIVNMVEHLSGEFEFWIVTRDRDLGDEISFQSVKKDVWQNVGKAKVYYVSPSKQTLRKLAKLIADTPHDILYLNSFFSFTFSIKPLLAVKYYGASRKPVILAPRGEFSEGALNLKQEKKYVYVKLSQMIGLYNNILFQASSKHEMNDIVTALNMPKEQIRIAMDLPEKKVLGIEGPEACKIKPSGTLKVIFLSRLSPMKNLVFALKVLQLVTRNVKFDVYGPREDSSYWSACRKLIDELPENVKVQYCGSVTPDEVKSTFACYDLFLFPTLGENYGHVIAESLSVGTPVLISDQTPWKNLEVDGLGWELPLTSLHGFVEKLECFVLESSDSRIKNRLTIQKKVFERLFDPESFIANRSLFRSVL